MYSEPIIASMVSLKDSLDETITVTKHRTEIKRATTTVFFYSKPIISSVAFSKDSFNETIAIMKRATTTMIVTGCKGINYTHAYPPFCDCGFLTHRKPFIVASVFLYSEPIIASMVSLKDSLDETITVTKHRTEIKRATTTVFFYSKPIISSVAFSKDSFNETIAIMKRATTTMIVTGCKGINYSFSALVS